MARPRLGVRARLTLVAVGAAAIGLSAGGWLLYRDVTATLSGALTQELRSHARDVAAEVARGVPPSLDTGLETQVLRVGGGTVTPAAEDALLSADELAEAASRPLVTDRADGPTPLRVVAVPVGTPSGAQTVVVVAGSTATVTHAQQRLLGRLLLAGSLLLGAAGAASWLLAGAALRPVRRMTRRARTLSTEASGERLPVPPGRDEVAELGTTLNGMLGRMAEARARERAFLDDASHEMRAPLAVIRGELELALLEHGPDVGDDVTRSLANALDETDRLSRLTDHLLVLARADAGMLTVQPELFSFPRVAERAATRAGGNDLELDLTGPDAVVSGDPVAVAQVVTNLVGNASRWADGRVRCECRSEGATVTLRVSDDGPGFAPDYLAHPFERFRRGDPSRGRSGSSTGLGLAIAAAVVAAHGGHIALGNDSDLGGAWVEVTLPTVVAGPPVRAGAGDVPTDRAPDRSPAPSGS